MKVTPGNNRRMVTISIISILILFILILIRLNGFVPDIFTYYVLHITDEITYLAMLWYVISILQFAGETVSIQTPFSILLGLELINFLLSYIRMDSTLITGTGTLLSLIFIYAAINAFRVKNKALSGPFRILGLALLLSMLFKFGLAFIPMGTGRPMYGPGRFIGLIDMIPLLAIFYLIIQTGKLLKEGACLRNRTWKLMVNKS